MILVDPPLPPLQHPMVQQSMQQMMNNPELMEQMIRNNPLFAGNPEMVGVISTLSTLIATFTDLFLLRLYTVGTSYCTNGELNSTV